MNTEKESFPLLWQEIFTRSSFQPSISCQQQTTAVVSQTYLLKYLEIWRNPCTQSHRLSWESVASLTLKLLPANFFHCMKKSQGCSSHSHHPAGDMHPSLALQPPVRHAALCCTNPPRSVPYCCKLSSSNCQEH